MNAKDNLKSQEELGNEIYALIAENQLVKDDHRKEISKLKEELAIAQIERNRWANLAESNDKQSKEYFKTMEKLKEEIENLKKAFVITDNVLFTEKAKVIKLQKELAKEKSENAILEGALKSAINDSDVGLAGDALELEARVKYYKEQARGGK